MKIIIIDDWELIILVTSVTNDFHYHFIFSLTSDLFYRQCVNNPKFSKKIYS